MAQKSLLQQAFRFTASDFSDSFKDAAYLAGKFGGWTFEGSCFAIKDGWLQVGSGSSNVAGIVKTPTISFSGRVMVVVRVYRKATNIQGTYSIKLDDGTEIKSKAVVLDNSSHPVTFIVDNWTPSTRVVISNVSGNFYVTNVDIYDIGNAYYYESFDYMTGTEQEDYSPSADNLPSSNRCDNSESLFAFVAGSTKNLVQGTRSIFFRNQDGSTFKTPQFPSLPEYSLLVLKIARHDNTTLSGQKIYDFTVTTEGTARLSPVNTVSSDSWAETRTEDISGLANRTGATYKFVVKNIAGTRLTFSGNYFFLDDIMLLPLSATTINEGSDNSARIAAYDGMTCNVTLTRTLKEGIWNTMCLPFDVTSDMIGNNAELRTLTSSTDGDFVFNKEENTVVAGTPFLVKVSAEVTNPTFSSVTVKDVQPKTVCSDDSYQFCGTYSPIALNTDGTHVFLGIDQAFHTPSAGGNSMNGLRAYFIVPKPDGTTTNARIAIYDEPSAIHDLSTSAAPKHSGCYDLTGRRHDAKQLSTGLYIRDGRKFYVK